MILICLLWLIPYSAKNGTARGTVTGHRLKKVSQLTPGLGTAKIVKHQGDNLGVPLSQALGHETAGQHEKPGTVLGTVAGQSPYSATVAAFESECPAGVETGRWRQAIADAAAFLATWGAQANACGWTARELLGLHPTTPAVAPRPHGADLVAARPPGDRVDRDGGGHALPQRRDLDVQAE